MIDPKNNPSIDPELEAIFERMREAPERDSQVVTRFRAKYEAQLDAYFESNLQLLKHERRARKDRLITFKENLLMLKNNYRFAFMFTAALVVLALVIFGGAGATAAAAKGALPGDALYTVKTGLEQARARMTSDAYDQAQMYMQFANLRLSETAALIDEGRFDDISTAVSEFESAIQGASESLSELSVSDPQRAALLSSQISDTLSSFSVVLSDMIVEVPEQVAAEMERAISVTSSEAPSTDDGEIEIVGVVEEITEDAWVIDGQTILITSMTEIKGNPLVGDQVKVHVVVADDGSLSASEIELATGDDANDNEDDGNDNEDDGNDNDDDGNDNDDDANDNDDDDGNDNDDDANVNDDDGNVNASDGNDNDDDGNNNDDDGNDNDDDDDDNDNVDDDNDNDNVDDDDDKDNDDDDDDGNENDNS